MKSDARMMVRTKSLNLSILTALFVFFFPVCFSMAGSNRPLPPGDYIFNSKSGDYEPFYPDSERKVTDFVSDCDNSPGLQRNADQFEFIKTAIMGKDNRCPIEYGPGASNEDKAFYGTGVLFDYSGECRNLQGARCSGTANLVIDGDIAISAAHVFRDERSGRYVDGKGYQFTIKVWVPPELRLDPNQAYEPRWYEIEEVTYGSLNPNDFPTKDYAFIKLKERAGKVVRKRTRDGKLVGKSVKVSDRYLVKPLPFKPLDQKKKKKNASIMGFHQDRGAVAQKNCAPSRIMKSGKHGQEVLLFNGDMVSMSSGSAIAVPDEDGNLTFAALNIGDVLPEGQTEFDQIDFDPNGRYNVALDGDSFFDEFLAFRRKYGRDPSFSEKVVQK